MAQEFHFVKAHCLFVGDDIALTFEAFDDDLVTETDEFGIAHYVSGTPFDVSGWAMAFAVRVTDTTNAVPVIAKSTSDGITITGTYDPDHDINTQRVQVSIADTDTFSDSGSVIVPPKKYRYSLKRTDPGSEKNVAYGDFVLREVPVRQ